MSEECGTCAHHHWKGLQNWCRLHDRPLKRVDTKCKEGFKDMYLKSMPEKDRPGKEREA